MDKGEAILDSVLDVPLEVQELEDSDEKSETDDSLSSEVEFSCDSGEEKLSNEKYLEKKFSAMLQKIDLSSQIKDSTAELSKRLKVREVADNEIQSKLKDIEAKVTKLRHD